MDRTRWIIFGVLILSVFGVLIANKKSSDIDVSKIDAAKVITADTVKKNKGIGTTVDHVYGSNSKKVVLIEYGDFQCPGCGSLYPSITPIKEYYKDQLTFVFRDFPLTTIHPNALAAASAAEAAGLQGKFWEYHNVLYENQDAWSSLDGDKRGSQFEKYAKQIGLNLTTFRKDIASKTVTQKIERDQALGKKIDVSATPTLVLNGKTLGQGEWNTPKQLEDIIRKELKASGQTIPDPLNK